MKVRVIGVGKADWGDFVAGLLAARRITRRSGGAIDVREVCARMHQLADEWRGADEVFLIDTMPGRSPGRVHRYEATAGGGGLAGEALGAELAKCVHEASARGQLPGRLTVFSIEAWRFGRECGVSPDVASAADRVADEILTEVSKRESALA